MILKIREARLNKMQKKISIVILATLLLIFGFFWLGSKEETQPISEVDLSVTKKESPVRATLFFAGDMMFDRYIRQKAEEGNYSDMLLDFEKKISGADVAIANLEGPITTNTSLSLGTNASAGGNHFTFTFDTKVAEALSAVGFDVLSLANNHSMNFGESGIIQTRNHLSGAGLQFFGDPLDGNLVSVSTTTNGIEIAFVGYNQFGYPGEAESLAEVKRLEASDSFIAVVPHWGEEYEKTPTPAVRALGHAFVDAGADMVIGAHSHIIGDNEIYRGVPIYYSLGNFVFDQYFQHNVRCGLVLEVVLEKTAERIAIADISESNSWLSETGRTLRQECK